MFYSLKTQLLNKKFSATAKKSLNTILFAMSQQPQQAKASSLSRIHDHTQTRHTR
jgi:hypothetical protein